MDRFAGEADEPLGRGPVHWKGQTKRGTHGLHARHVRTSGGHRPPDVVFSRCGRCYSQSKSLCCDRDALNYYLHRPPQGNC